MRTEYRAALVSGVLVLVSSAGTASGQGLTVHAMTGQPVVGGLEGEVYSAFSQTWDNRTIPRINNGHIVFRTSTNRAYLGGAPLFAGQIGSATPVFRFVGETGIEGVQYSHVPFDESSRQLRITADGQVGFVARLQGNGISWRNDEIALIGNSGNWRHAFREGAQVPGEADGVLLSGTPNWGVQIAQWAVSDTGRATAHSYYTRPGVVIGDLWGLVTQHVGDMESVASRSLSEPWQGTYFAGWPMHQFRGSPSTNSSGTTAFYATFNYRVIGTSHETHGVAVYASGVRTLAFRDGDLMPGMKDTRLFIPEDLFQGGPGWGVTPGLNNEGHVATPVVLKNAAYQTVGSGIIRITEGGPQLLAKTGDAKPGSAGDVFGVNDLRTSRTVLSGSGAVAFADQSRRGVFVGTSGSDLRLAFDPLSAIWPQDLGQPLVITETIGINDSDQLVAAFSFPTLPGSTAVAAWDPVAGNILIAYTGQTIEVLPGVFRTIRAIDINGMDGVVSGGGEDGRPNSLDHHGHIVFTAHFTNNQSAVLVATIPAPAVGIIAGLGMLMCARRRR